MSKWEVEITGVWDIAPAVGLTFAVHRDMIEVYSGDLTVEPLANETTEELLRRVLVEMTTQAKKYAERTAARVALQEVSGKRFEVLGIDLERPPAKTVPPEEKESQ